MMKRTSSSEMTSEQQNVQPIATNVRINSVGFLSQIATTNNEEELAKRFNNNSNDTSSSPSKFCDVPSSSTIPKYPPPKRIIPLVSDAGNSNSSAMESLETLPDQAVILERLVRIREYKQQVLNTIDKLKNNGEEIDRNLLSKLIKAYDSFKEQEEQYLMILQKVLAIKQQYTQRLAESSSLSELSDGSDRTPLPSFSANLAAGEPNSQNSRQNVLSKSLRDQTHNSQAAPPQQYNNSTQKRRNSDTVSINNRGDKENYQPDQTGGFLMKSQELEALKEKLETLRTLCDLTSDEMINESNDESQEKTLKTKLQILKDNKKRVDELLNCIDDVDEVIDSTNGLLSRGNSIVSSDKESFRNFNVFGFPPHLTNNSSVHDMSASNLHSTVAKTTSTPCSTERNQKSTNENTLSRLESDQTSNVMQQKFDELTATKNRLAKLQQLMGHLQNNADLGVVAPMTTKPVNNLTNVGGKTFTENGEDSESDVANMAALSFRMRSAYESKLNEQQQAVQNLQAEHERLMAIKNQLMTLSNAQLGPIIGQNLVSASFEQTNRQDPSVAVGNDEVWRNLRQQQIVQQQQQQQQRQDESTPAIVRRSRSRPTTGHQLNNVKENVSDHSNLNRSKSRINENLTSEFGSLDHDDSLNEDIQNATLTTTATIVNNPRLPSFRRNNQLDNARGVGKRGDDVPLPSTPRRTSLGSCGGGQQDYRRSDSRERCFGVSLEQQYLQLQQHIDSIRSIFQQLMKDHNTVGGSAQQTQNNNFTIAGQPTQQNLLDAAAKLLAQQQNPWDHLYSSLSPSSLAVQQQQLMVSLFSCQQQLQLQQMEMRYLQQLCQDLLNARRPTMAENSSSEIYQGTRSRSASLVQTNLQPGSSGPLQPTAVNLPPLDGRPLSTASLYNLLAPNPYLTFPYYAAPQQQHVHQVFSSNEQQQQKFAATQNVNYRSVVQPYASSSPRYQQKVAGNRSTPMSQSLIEHGSERVYSDGETNVNAKLMTMSDVSRPATNNLESKSSKRQKNLDGQPDYGDTPELTLTGDQFDALREMIYSEVATLISQNEQRPHFLLELFRELQLLSSDHLRTRALQAIRNVLNRYLIDERQHSEVSRQMRSDAGTQSVVEETQTESPGTSDYDDFKQTRRYVVATESAQLKENVNSPSNEVVVDEIILIGDGLNESKNRNKDANDSKVKDVNEVNATKSLQQTSSTEQKNVDQNADLPATSISRSGSKANVDVGGLEQQIQSVVDELIPVLKDNVDSVCNSQLLHYLRKLVITLATTKCMPSGSVNTFFQRQLSSILDDTLAKFQGQKLHDCGEELLADVSEVVFNELAFFRLMQNIDSVDNEPRKSDADESEDNLGHETTEPEDGSESERSSAQPSSPEIAAEEIATQDVSEISEDVDVSTVTTVSPSRESVKVNAEIKNEISPVVEKETRRLSGDSIKAVEVVLTNPLTVQVTSATDEDENSISTSESASMHTAGNHPYDATATSDGLMKQTSADSRETSPPDELLDAEEIPENIDSLDQLPAVGLERETTTFDLDFEPHPEDKLQLTIDSVEFRNLQNQLTVPDEVEEEDEEQQVVVTTAEDDAKLKLNAAETVQTCGAD